MKSIFNSLLIISFTMLLLAVDCHHEDIRDLSIYNDSQDTILYYIDINEQPTFPYNNIYLVNNNELYINQCIAPSESNKYRRDFDFFGERDYMLYLYIFSKATVDTVPWDTIQKYELELDRIDRTYDELEESGWEVSYPQ